jgi:hypothetical protein
MEEERAIEEAVRGRLGRRRERGLRSYVEVEREKKKVEGEGKEGGFVGEGSGGRQ